MCWYFMIMDFYIHLLTCASQQAASFGLKALVFIMVMDDIFYSLVGGQRQRKYQETERSLEAKRNNKDILFQFTHSLSVIALSISGLWWIWSLFREHWTWGRNAPWIGHQSISGHHAFTLSHTHHIIPMGNLSCKQSESTERAFKVSPHIFGKIKLISIWITFIL